MPDATLSQAIREAYAAAPAGVIVYATLELYHPAWSVPIRVVQDRVDLIATLEASAPRDANQAVTFTAFGFEVTRPEVGPGGTPQVTVEIDNVSREVVANIFAAQGNLNLLTVIYREFLSTDLTGPQNNPPLSLTVLSISADVFRVRATCGFTDVANKKFPREEYSAERFPGLIAQ